MIKIKSIKFNHEIGCHEFVLDNNDIILMSLKLYDRMQVAKPTKLISVKQKSYTPVFNDQVYTDDLVDIIGFEAIESQSFLDHINLYFGTEFESVPEFIKNFRNGDLSNEYEDDSEALTHLLMFMNSYEKVVKREMD